MSETSTDRFIVMVHTTDGKVAAIGTARNRLFTSLDSAQKVATKVEKEHPLWRALVLTLEPSTAVTQ